MTDRRDVHAVPFEVGGVDHRADRRCPCGVRPMRDLNQPARQVWVHRIPPTAYSARTVSDEYLDPEPTAKHKRSTPP